MKAFLLLVTLACFSAATAAILDPNTTISAVKAADGSLDVLVPNGIPFNIPANVLTLGTALLNQVASLVNVAQTTGRASISVPISSSGNLLSTSVNGVNYSLYIAEQLQGLIRAFDAFNYMIGKFRY